MFSCEVSKTSQSEEQQLLKCLEFSSHPDKNVFTDAYYTDELSTLSN